MNFISCLRSTVVASKNNFMFHKQNCQFIVTLFIIFSRKIHHQRAATTLHQANLHRSLIYDVQLREYYKDLEYRLHHRLSKFLNLKPISYFLGVYIAWFFIDLETIGVSQIMIQHLRKSHFNFGGKFEFRSQFSYYSCTLIM